MSKKSPDKTDAYVGSRIKIARLMANLSQEELGAKLGLTFQQVQKYERGINRCSPGRLLAIAQATGRPIQWFYGDERTSGTPEAGEIERMLTAPGGVNLARAYLALADNRHRHLVVEVAVALATGEQVAAARKAA